jgi:hypothetical protein
MIRSPFDPFVLARPIASPAMPMLPARHYESPHTKFMRELMEKRPQLERDQREARAIWWDKDPRALDEGRRMDEARVPQKPYVYQTG